MWLEGCSQELYPDSRQEMYSKGQEVASSSSSSLLVCLYRPVLAESNMEPPGKAERSMAGESLLQHHKVNNRRLDLELSDNNLVTGILVQKLNL